ncbi:hypothetical protein AAFF_G00378910 [Aldrovandia affinis]|uniref:Endonuclease/exonuclease/phosphatase domain-containing protein n=1 Tax=Aldrovandia affinis TaxID=143900 RepID=A0AAD7SFF8_9TELE|nr:hypothetical protein AAFF_G00378910 [Aldrovandia affinis]
MVRVDRDRTLSCKKSAGGLILYVNTKWCNPGHVTVNEIICTPDIELLAVGLRPYDLPREFSHAIVVVVYIPPLANAVRACDVIHSTVARLQTDHPGAFLTINGDFNHAKLPKTLTGFTQYVKCSTRENKILDMMYTNVKETYSSSAALGGCLREEWRGLRMLTGFIWKTTGCLFSGPEDLQLM